MSGVAVTISSALRATGNQACGLAAATSVMGASTRPSRSRCASEIPAEVGPACVVEEGEGEISLEHGVRDLRGIEVHIHGEGALLRRLVRPPWLLAGLLQATDSGQCLGAGDQGQIEAARPDVARHFSGEHERNRATDAGVLAPRRHGAEAVGQPSDGVVVLPRLRVHDVDALQCVEEGRRICHSGVGRCVTRQLLPHVERFGRAVGRVGGMPGVAGDADDAGGAGVGGQRSGAVSRATCRAWQWRGRR